MLEKIEQYFKNKSHVKIFLNSGLKCYGYILNFGTNCILVHVIDDFHIYGYAIFPYKSIKNIIHTKQEKYFEKILKNEGIYDKIKFNIGFNVNSYGDIFKQLNGKLISIGRNINFKKEKIQKYIFGKVSKNFDNYIEFKSFSSYGKWYKNLTKIKFNKIYMIDFDYEYINTFGKYLN